MIILLTDQYAETVGTIQSVSYPEESRENIESLRYHWRTFPDYCFIGLQDGRPCGYLISHPWPRRLPPPLDAMSYTTTQTCDSLFIHDLALLPHARGKGLASKLVINLLLRAKEAGFPFASLVSVQGTQPFWECFGFQKTAGLSPEYFDSFSRYYPQEGFVYMEKTLI